MSDRPPPGKKATALRPAVDPATLDTSSSSSARLARPGGPTPSGESSRLTRPSGKHPDTTRPGESAGSRATDPTLLIGRTLGPCQILELIGEGGLGRVYRARHTRLEHDVAVKVIGRTKPEALARFRREAQIAAKLNHPHVARVLDTDEQDGIHFIIQELVPGTSVEEHVRRSGKLGVDEALVVAIGLASGLDSIHKAGIVHRDLKPANVIITPDGQPKLLDFGIAKDLFGEAGFTDEKAMLGTPTFLAPEQVGGNARTGPAADIYGLGGTLYFALTARAPLEPQEDDTLLRYLNRRAKELPPDAKTLRPELPAALSTLLGRLLAIEPEDRPSAASVHEQLKAIDRALPRAPQRSAITPPRGVEKERSSERAPLQARASGRLPALDRTPSPPGSGGAPKRPTSENPRPGAESGRQQKSESNPRPNAGHGDQTNPALRSTSDRQTAVSTSMNTPSPAPRGIQGSLEEMPLTELLQGVEFNQKTGHIEIEADGGPKGVIEFQEGNPWDAKTADGRTGEEAMRALLRARKGGFALRSDSPRAGTRRVKVSFTRLLLDASRVDDESGRHAKTEAAPKPAPAPPPPKPDEKEDLADSSSALQAIRRLYSTDEVKSALELLEAEAHAAGDPVGDPFLGCTIGSFEVQKLLGVFGGERRYLGWDTSNEARCLLRIFPLFGPQEEEFKRVAKRAELVLGIEHPSLQRCLGSGRTRDAFFAAFDPPMGVTTEQLVAQAGPQPTDRTITVLEGAARALKALHRRDQVHGHISPATIRIDPNGGVILAEAGLGRPHPTFAFLSGEGSELLAPPGFAAPETLDLGQHGPAADIFALGCVAWTLLMGRAPARPDDDPHLLLERVQEVPPVKAQRGPALPEAVVTLVQKMTAADPKARYRNVNDLLADLRACREGGEVKPFAPASLPPGQRGPRVGLLQRNPRLLTSALLIAALGLAGGLGWVLWQSSRVELPTSPFDDVVFPAPAAR